MNDEPNHQQVKISCPSCRQKLDVSQVEPFSEIDCPTCGAKILVPQRFSHYLLEEPIARGEVASVYRAIDLKLDRQVAVKVFSREISTHPALADTLFDQTKRLAVFNHPNIIPLFSNGEFDNCYYVAMEFMAEHSLYQKVKRDYPLPVHLALHYIEQAARGLAAAYREGVLHGGVNPRNILLSQGEIAKVCDFGMSSFRALAVKAGALDQDPILDHRYASPEMLAGQPGDHRGDIFSLGACLYFALIGRPPFPESRRELESDPDLAELPAPPIEERPEIGEALNRLLLELLDPDPDQRPGNYHQIIVSLDKLRTKAKRTPSIPIGRIPHRPGLHALGRAPGQIMRSHYRRIKRQRRFVQVGCLTLLFLVVFASLLVWQARRRQSPWYQQAIAPAVERLKEAFLLGPRLVFREEPAGQTDPAETVAEDGQDSAEPEAAETVEPQAEEEEEEVDDSPVGNGQVNPLFQLRPRPPDLNFRAVQAELQEYLRQQSEELRELERDRILLLSRLHGHLRSLMRLPYDGTENGILLASGRRIQGIVPFCNEHELTIRIGRRPTTVRTLKWEDLALEQYFSFFQFYVDKRLSMNDTQQNELLSIDPERDAAQDYFRMALLADWYGFYNRAREYARRAEALDPMLRHQIRKFLYYLHHDQ